MTLFLEFGQFIKQLFSLSSGVVQDALQVANDTLLLAGQFLLSSQILKIEILNYYINFLHYWLILIKSRYIVHIKSYIMN